MLTNIYVQLFAKDGFVFLILFNGLYLPCGGEYCSVYCLVFNVYLSILGFIFCIWDACAI